MKEPAMADINLDKLSLDELKKLQKDVTKAIDTLHERRRQEALAAVETTVREMGFSLADLVGPARKAKLHAPAKYRHPDNPSVTWSGRGRQPAWLREAIAAGKSKEDFLL
jgi:DNA-binding protein H-NS